jgi:16S rRNA (guanine966-N2)-methyltransferase
MFDVLMSLDVIDGASVLDCFAGSGALGIEALSRGAASVTFLDTDREALRAIESNLERVGFAGRPGVRVLRSDALGFLGSSRAVYDLAFLDPPYGFAEWSGLLSRLSARTAVLESNVPVEVPATYVTYRTYRHGGTLFAVVTAPAPPDETAIGEDGQGEGVST